MRLAVASKSKHWPFWQALQAAGLDIAASWIDAPFNHNGDELDPDGWREHWRRKSPQGCDKGERKMGTSLLSIESLVEFGDRAEHLAHQLGRGRVVNEGAGIVCRDKIDG